MTRCFHFPGPTGLAKPSPTSILLPFREWGTFRIARIPIAPQQRSPRFSTASPGADRRHRYGIRDDRSILVLLLFLAILAFILVFPAVGEARVAQSSADGQHAPVVQVLHDRP